MNIFFVTRESSYIHMARDSSDISSSIQWSETKQIFGFSSETPIKRTNNLDYSDYILWRAKEYFFV